jgi:UDP-galactopyranose mutase
MSQFTNWTPFEHRVRALLPDGSTTPLPVNRTTIEDVFGVALSTDEETNNFLIKLRKDIRNPASTDDFFLASVGEELANLFFRPYTKKMWGEDPKLLAPSIGARLLVRTNRDDRYFTDNFQALPSQGYSIMFENIFSHSNILLHLCTEFSIEMEKNFDHCFLAVPIDAYFDYVHGKLPYRSIRFSVKLVETNQPSSVLNYTDNGKYTRSTQWDMLPNSPRSSSVPRYLKTVTFEEPCSVNENIGEYYYPVQTESSKLLYAKYRKMASGLNHVTFCGRTGLFRYIDMIPAVTLHLDMAEQFLSKS